MKYLKGVAFSILLCIIFLTACKKDPEAFGTAAYIPETATSVTGFDIQRMMDKADFASIQKMEFYSDIVGDANKQNELFATVLKDPNKSGIDLSGKIYMSTDINEDDPELFTTHILVPLADAKAFDELAKAADFNFEKKNGLNVFVPGNGNDGIMMWDEKLLVLSISNNDTVNTELKTKMLFEMAPEQ